MSSTIFEKYYNEKIFFNSNDEVKSFFINKNINNFIIKDNVLGKVNVNVDSYQQSNKLSYTKPTLNYSFKYNTTAHVGFFMIILIFFCNN